MRALKDMLTGPLPLVIAEIGVNHNGRSKSALALLEMAARCGAGAVKFQYFKADRLARKDAPLADYQKRSESRSQHRMLQDLEFGMDDLELCRARTAELGLFFGCTPFDPISLREVDELNPDFIKIGSGDVDNAALLQAARNTGRPVILSTGMSSLQEALLAAEPFDPEEGQLALLHCVSSYPAPEAECNLQSIRALAASGHLPGFSDHTSGSRAATLALALGARIIEKHVTLDRGQSGPDHACSLDEKGFTAYLDELALAVSILGDGRKRVMPCERDVRLVARKSICAAHDLPAGRTLRAQDVTCLRPGSGLAPDRLPELIGKHLTQDISIHQDIRLEDLSDGSLS